ncbi:MAG TPA: class II fructose-bisphosphate aldolase, partial [Spirochaetia bacterium]|nr:class II fructose-bisphosphate aldolase [Spirochaetia bacterium]
RVADIMKSALAAKTVVPAFNVPYLPMMEPIVAALRETKSFGLIAVARLEWTKFEAGGVKAIYEEYKRVGDPVYTRLHLDHVPVIDEDDLVVDYRSIIEEALSLGYHSVMVDGSRLSLDENIEATRSIVSSAHKLGVPVEAELGSVLGHEEGPTPPYEELFRSGRGFTEPDDAARFVSETGVDWLSVAVGSIHGAVSKARRSEEKVHARLNIERLSEISEKIGVPIVLHGGSGIPKSYVLDGVRHGITKINIGTAVRQVYERAESAQSARAAVYDEVVRILTEDLEVAGTTSSLIS